MFSSVTKLAMCTLLCSIRVLAQGANEEVRCDYRRREACVQTGCQSVVDAPLVSGSFLLVPSLPKLADALARGTDVEMRQCDAKGCTPFAMHVAGGEGMLNLTQTNRLTTSLRIWIGAAPGSRDQAAAAYLQGDFIEIETVRLSSVIGYGHCNYPKL